MKQLWNGEVKKFGHDQTVGSWELHLTLQAPDLTLNYTISLRKKGLDN